MTLPVPLSYLLAEHQGEEAKVPFLAELHGIPVEVTAVMEKTVVYQERNAEWPERRTIRVTEVLVDPLEVSWRVDRKAKFYYGRAPGLSAEERAAIREQHDAKVRENRERVEAEAAARKEVDQRAVVAAAEQRKEQESMANVVTIPVESARPVEPSRNCKVCGRQRLIRNFIKDSHTCHECSGAKGGRTRSGVFWGDPTQVVERLEHLKRQRDYWAAQAEKASAKRDDYAERYEIAEKQLRKLRDKLTKALS